MTTDKHREQAHDLVRGWLNDQMAIGQLKPQADGELVCRIAHALSSRDTEVREVLEGLRMRSPACWCDSYPVKEHGKPCLAAQALYVKLQPASAEE